MRGPIVSQPDSSVSRTARRSCSSRRRSNSGMSGDVAIPRPPRVGPAVLVERTRDLSDSLRHGHLRLEVQHPVDLVERHLVVARILTTLDVRDRPTVHLLADRLDEHLLRVVLLGAPRVEDLSLRLLPRRLEDRADGPRGVVYMDVRAPELLTEDLELVVMPQIARELVDRQVESHP